MAKTRSTPPTLPAPGPASSAPARRRSRRWIAWAVLAAAAVLAWFWQPIHSRALTAAAYGAHVTCSCRYLGGRGLSDCRKDFEPGMGLVTLSEDTEAKSVTARYPLLASQTATYREGQGCVAEPWEE